MKIICIGLNYSNHVAEMGATLPSEPIFFMKPDTALLRGNDPFYIPDFSDEIEYECEAVVRISRVCKAIDEKFAHRAWNELGLGIDFTARDLQRRCKEQGRPWEIAKAFDNSAVISDRFITKDELLDNGKSDKDFQFSMALNGEIRQQGRAEDMIFSVDRIIAHVSRYVTLKVGDLIFTGTPSGVGRIAPGDRITASLLNQELLNFQIK